MSFIHKVYAKYIIDAHGRPSIDVGGVGKFLRVVGRIELEHLECKILLMNAEGTGSNIEYLKYSLMIKVMQSLQFLRYW